ncbi:MAG: NAD-glutamate dehydrogenase, partial [Casimicrobiaceae bacterium]
MNDTTHDLRTQRLDEVARLVAAKVAPEQRATVQAFVTRYFSQVDPEDLHERTTADLYGAALSHWNFARKRERGSARVRVFNPAIEEHGWQSTHTIVEIVNDDMPFLVDSVTMEANRHGLTLHLIMHPIIAVERAADGTLTGLAADNSTSATRESFIRVEVDRVMETAGLDALAADIVRVLGDVRAAVNDWKPMVAKAREIAAQVSKEPPPLPEGEAREGVDFVVWLADNHFTFLGYRCHDLVTKDGQDALQIVAGSSLGIFRGTETKDVSSSFAALPPEVKAYARRPELLVVTKSTARSTVHRPGYMDYIAIKRFDARGEVVGEHRFLGLYTSTAYSTAPDEIPLLRRKTANVVRRASLPQGGHAEKALRNILATYPRDELFQVADDELQKIAMGILHLGERQRFRLFVRRDPFERFISCLIYAPRENYSTEMRQKWQAILLEAFNGSSSEFNVHLSESKLARILIIVRTSPGHVPDFDARALEARLAEAARLWVDELRTALVAALGEAPGLEVARRFAGAFPAAYREDYDARAAVPDIQMMDGLSEAEPLGMSLYRPLEAGPGMLRFKLFRAGAPMTLSDSLPMLEHLGMRVEDERPYRIAAEGRAPIWMHDLGLLAPIADTEVAVDPLNQVFEDAFAQVFRGDVESDDFNRLVVLARIPAVEIVVLRAYAKYMRQTGFALSQTFIEATLATHAKIAAMLVTLFKHRFDPQGGTGALAGAADDVRAIEAALEGVENLSEDRVLRQYLALIQATLRTNYWVHDAAGARKSYVSFKFDPSKVPGLPEPKPMFEIFVYSPRFEGVHLRGGRVARGGLRWSDRPEDFRTEVLGLVKAQMVKNTVIVPVGSKGGFVLKRAPAASDREAFIKEGVACYKDYLRGLLDLTDNRVGDAIVPPRDVKRHDSDDPYLVVAADKGTATFSDYANGISQEYGFWLGDAFASGGSVGYDHKKVGITARGAWECVKHHFHNLGQDCQTEPFTCAGVGDLMGDVFGNGALLSPVMKLVAAFNHLHIFVDPSPDIAKTFVERQRMFALPRSTWRDYDATLISPGGGIFDRSAKAIPVSPEIATLLDIQGTSVSGEEMIRRILTANIDLLYNGGIGTYVKASSEDDAQVGDRANDRVRVDAKSLRARVVAEGGNLGLTQKARL